MLSTNEISLYAKKLNLLDLSFNQLQEWLTGELKQPAFRVTQIWQWVWQKMARDFDCMSNVSKNLKEILKGKAEIIWPDIADIQQSPDGTIKFLLKLADSSLIETVLIPSKNRTENIRWSQCLSTQVGCPMTCSFCATGQMGFKRNLTSAEILGQVLIGRNYLNDFNLSKPVLRNLVFMGMGEPLLNMNSLLPALETLGHDQGLNFSPRRMTVSTCGVKEGLKILGEKGHAYIAISLHAPNQELREKIMPNAAKFPLEDLLESLKNYPLKTRETITFEYLLLGGINDGLIHAKELTKILSKIKGKVNLIVYNPVANLPYKAPEEEAVAAFQKYLCDHNITAILRKSKGADIMAACGQLAAKSL